MKKINQRSLFLGFFITAFLGSATIFSCKKTDTPLIVEPTTVTDVDGNVYPIVKIGTQTWMTENLITTKYNDSTAISTGLSNAEWTINSTGAYTFYDNAPSNNAIYGKLYNWSAVNTGKLAPKGWHIPTIDEWNTLVTFLGGSMIAGGKMKSMSNLWNAPNTGADNSSGFKGLPAGFRGTTGSYGTIGNTGFWWASSPRNLTQGDYIKLDHSATTAFTQGATRTFGYSVRCVKN
jgi:uncharacterized protein (TIGR02145 family)